MGKLNKKNTFRKKSRAFRQLRSRVCKLFDKLSGLEARGLVASREFQDVFGELVSLMSDMTDFSVSSPGFSGLIGAPGQPTGISQLQAKLAAAYGAGAAFLGTAGTSVANISLLLALQCARPERCKFIVDSAMHGSVRGGLVASGAEALILKRKICPRTGIPLSDVFAQLAALLAEHAGDCNTVVLTMPGYVGDIADLKAIYKLCKSYSVDLVLDGAWGALYGIHPSFPDALIKYADYVTLSLHKASMAPQQVSLTLIRDANHASTLELVLRLGFATTSPNPHLLLVAEHRSLKMLENPNCFDWDGAIIAADLVRSSVGSIHPKLGVLDASDLSAAHLSPVQVVLDTSSIEVSAITWKQILSDNFQRDAEHAEQNYMVLTFAPGNMHDAKQLVKDLRTSLFMAIAEDENRETEQPDVSFMQGDVDGSLDIREALMSPSEWVPLEDAIGRVLSGYVMTYPTGRGLSPGSVLTRECCETILNAIRAGYVVHGVRGDKEPLIRVSLPAEKQGLPAYLQVTTYRTPGLPKGLMQEASDFYAGGWVGDSFNQFVMHEDDPGVCLSPTQYMERAKLNWPASIEPSDWLPLKQLNELSDDLAPGFHRIVDPEQCRKVHAARFADTGYLTIVRDLRVGEIVGMLSARVTTFRRLAETTEWFRPFLFCDTFGNDNFDTQFNHSMPAYKEALEKIAWHFDLSERHLVCSVDSQLIHPAVRGTGAFHAMMQSMASAFEPAHAHLPLLSSVSSEGSLARSINESVAGKIVYDVLPNGECLAHSDRTLQTMAYALVDRSHWAHALQEQFQKESETHFPSPWDHPNVRVERTKDGRGLGVFVIGDGIRKGETVARFVGETYISERASALHKKFVDHAIQVNSREYLFGRFGLAQLINSSCSPNLGLHNRVELRALVDIQANCEVTWTYPTSEDSDWSAECKCGSPDCPGWIYPFRELPDETRERLLDAGIVSDWIVEKLEE